MYDVTEYYRRNPGTRKCLPLLDRYSYTRERGGSTVKEVGRVARVTPTQEDRVGRGSIVVLPLTRRAS